MILSADHYGTNAAMVAAVAELGWIATDQHGLDPTYGRGRWWAKWQPEQLTCTDLNPAVSPPDGVADFTRLPWPDGTFDFVAYDPPYVAKGGRETSGIREMDDRYGQVSCPKDPAALQQLINKGLRESLRVVKPRGIVLVKCKNYVSSGKLWRGEWETEAAIMQCDAAVVDELRLVAGGGPQPPNRRQVHARQNTSVLFVVRAPK